MKLMILLLIVLWFLRTRPLLRGGGLSTVLIPIGPDGVIRFNLEILPDGAIDEYLPTSFTRTFGLFGPSGYCYLGLTKSPIQVGVVVLNRFVGFWHDKEYYLSNPRRFLPGMFIR